MSDYLSWPCPSCGGFTLQGDNNLSCKDCSNTISRSQYRISMDYAAFAYRYGHLFRSVYEEQLKADDNIKPVTLGEAHPIAIATSLVILSATHSPTANWFLIRQTVKRFTDSYLKSFGDECAIEDSELKAMNKNIREFTNDFSETLPKLRNAVFEEIFADHCSKSDNESLFALQHKAMEAPEEQKTAFDNEFNEKFQKIMAKTFKKVAKLPKPSPEELGGYWDKVLSNSN